MENCNVFLLVKIKAVCYNKIMNNLIINHIIFSNYSDIHVINAGYEKTAAKKPIRRLSDFKAFSMHFVMSGAGYLKVNNQTMRIEKNRIFFLFPNMPIEYYPDKKTPWKYSWIDFTGSKALEFLQRININKDNPVVRVDNPAAVSRMFMQNVTDCSLYESFSDIVATASFYKILAEILKQASSPPAAKTDTGIINKVLEYINANFANPDLDINVVASHIGFHRVSLARLMRQKTGITFTNHLTRIRIQAAIILFDKGAESIGAVAESVGFTDPLYFSKVFKKYNLVSPREHLKRIAAKKS
jgi:AraC-like DNA-binding protein